MGSTGEAEEVRMGEQVRHLAETVLRKALRLELIWFYLGAARRYWQKV